MWDYMRRSRHLRATWLGRFVRGRLPDRNPLRRGTDRLETAILAGLFAVLCVTAPFLAAAASGWEHGISLREVRAQQAALHETRATLLDDAQDTGAYPVLTAEANVRWMAPDGQTVTEVMQVPEGAQAGRVIWIWTNPSGRFITPLMRNQIPARDDLAATAAVACLCSVALVAGLAVRRTLDRRRMTAWGIDWTATEPRWNTRR
jgi:hypothetical protein